MKTIMTLLLVVVLTLLGSVVLESPVTDAATDPATQTTAVTPVANVGSMTLTSQHWYTNTTQMSVVGATSGDLTTTTTVGADRKILTISGMGAAAEDVTVTYITEMDDAVVSIVLKIIPFLVIMMGIVAALGAVAVGGLAVTGRYQVGGSMIQGVLTIFLGVILIPVVLSFQSQAKDTYSVAPEYIGVLAVLSLMTIAYVLALLSSAIGSFAPQIRSFGGGFGGE